MDSTLAVLIQPSRPHAKPVPSQFMDFRVPGKNILRQPGSIEARF
jgi:hypothetical protein